MMKNLSSAIAVTIIATSCASPSRQPAFSSAQPQDKVVFFYTPKDMHQSWLTAIGHAKKSIFMEMFHLTDPQIVEALRAKGKKIDIRLILDFGNLEDAGAAKIKDEILVDRPNIQVFPSSGPPAGFTQTHTKAMIVDGSLALITSINLTGNAAVQRDYGIETRDPDVISEMNAVFTADVQNSQNAQNGQQPVKFTPEAAGQGKLIWSPVNSEARLVNLIQEASLIPDGPEKYLSVTVENLGDAAIQNALSTAAQNGVHVQIIVPQCVLGENGPRNYNFFQNLKNGVEYRVMPYPSSVTQPYMHGKMMVLGNGRAYIGSVNYSKNSTKMNRELGIIFKNSKVALAMKTIFDGDWDKSQEVPNSSDRPTCPTNTSDPSKTTSSEGSDR